MRCFPRAMQRCDNSTWEGMLCAAVLVLCDAEKGVWCVVVKAKQES
jgi:hypothetical protein